MEIEINEKFKECLHLMENTRKNVFVTGRAGTGKSTLLNYFRENTRKKVVVLAPTGVAAINVNGQTIHSFFRFKPDVNINSIKRLKGPERELYRKLECIIIDEISMVRADLLDCVDKFLRLNRDVDKPFGGIQMIFFGDLYQLPPVVRGKERDAFKKYYKSHYFFDSKVFQNFEMEFVELEKIYRQTDQKFIELLNSIRKNSITEEQLKIINKRVDPNFKIPKDQLYIQLTTTNDMATKINETELSKIKKPLHEFEGKIKGNFEEQYLPTDIILRLKVGSQIMLVNNDSDRRWVNGTVGKITEIDDNYIEVELIDGFKVEVVRYTWKVSEVFYNKETDMIESRTIGSFTQYPLKLAWAITIHKSQGKTFEKVVIDLGRGTFTPGQVYVALSRCKTLDGIVLRKPISKKNIFLDWKIVNFLTKYQYKISEKKLPLNKKIQIIEDAIKSKSKLEIVYLKTNEEKSRRIIEPIKVGGMSYMGKSYIGVESFCHKTRDLRVFRVDRILEIRPV